MSIILNDAVEIDRFEEEVFAHLIDVSRDPEWQEGLVEAKYTSDGPIAVGTTGIHIAKPMGKTIKVGWQLTEYDEPKQIAWKFISGPFTGNERYRLEATATGTKLRHEAELYPHGLLRLVTPLIRGSWEKQSLRNLQELKGILESR